MSHIIKMNNKILGYLNENNLRSPASITRITEVENYLGIKLPKQYSDFLLFSNGYEGAVGNSYVSIWRIEQLIEFNEGYSVIEFAPNLIAFASDGSGDAYTFDTKQGMRIVQTIGLGLEALKIIARDFNEFIEKLYNGL